jgi:hypothetical protein
MSVPKWLALSVVVLLGLSTVADAAPRSRYREAPAYGSYGAQGAYDTRPAVGSDGGYSTDPKTRQLEILADKYKPGW